MVGGFIPLEKMGRSFPIHENGKKLQKQTKIKTGTLATEIRIMEERFSLCPYYSVKQLHQIRCIQTERKKKGQAKIFAPEYPARKHVIIKNAFNQEVIQ